MRERSALTPWDHEKERRTRIWRRGREREDVVFMKGEGSLDGDRIDVRESNRIEAFRCFIPCHDRRPRFPNSS